MSEGSNSWRILITGGSGFIGTNLAEHYRGRAQAVMNVDVRPPPHPAHGSTWRACDILDRDGMARAVEDFAPTHILHMGGRTDLGGTGVDDYAANTEGVSNLIAALSGAASVRVIFASSRMVCEIGYQPADEFDVRPTTAYGVSKVEGERIVRQDAAELPWTIVRPTSIWGPWFGVPYFGFFRAAARGRYVHPKGRVIRKSFGYVGNTIEQLHHLLAAPASDVAGRTIYLADYPPLEVKAWAQAIARQCGGPPVREVPTSALRVAAKGGDLLGRLGADNPPLTSFRLDNLLTEMVYELNAIRELAGDLPFTQEAGVTATLEWMRAHGHL